MSDKASSLIGVDELWIFYMEAKREIEALERNLEKVVQERDALLEKVQTGDTMTLPARIFDLTGINLLDWS